MDAPMDMLMEFSRDAALVVLVVVRFPVDPARPRHPSSCSSSRAGMFSRNLIFSGRWYRELFAPTLATSSFISRQRTRDAQ
jgi:hypothetical protein